MKTHSTPLLVFAMSAAATPALAEGTLDYSVETGLSTLGLFVAPTTAVGQNFNIRAPLYFGSFTGDVDYEGNTGAGELDVTSLHIMGDYHIGDSGFRLSGGVSIGGYNGTATYVNPTLDGTTYTTTITADFEQDNNVTPVAALGYTFMVNDRWGISAEAGVRVTSMDVTTTGQENLGLLEQTEFNQDIQEINDDLDDIPVIPFISLGAVIKF